MIQEIPSSQMPVQQSPVPTHHNKLCCCQGTRGMPLPLPAFASTVGSEVAEESSTVLVKWQAQGNEGLGFYLLLTSLHAAISSVHQVPDLRARLMCEWCSTLHAGTAAKLLACQLGINLQEPALQHQAA